MAYTVKIGHDELITLLQDHYDDKVYENIKDGDEIEEVNISHSEIEIVIGEKES